MLKRWWDQRKADDDDDDDDNAVANKIWSTYFWIGWSRM